MRDTNAAAAPDDAEDLDAAARAEGLLDEPENTYEEPLKEDRGRQKRDPGEERTFGPTPVGILRAGYTMAMGDRVVYGRRKVPLTPDVARLHLHKFENKAEIKRWLGIPVQEPRPDALSDATARGREAIDAHRNARRPAAAAITRAEVKALVSDAVVEMGKSISDSVALQISELARGIREQIEAATKPAPPAAASSSRSGARSRSSRNR